MAARTVILKEESKQILKKQIQIWSEMLSLTFLYFSQTNDLNAFWRQLLVRKVC